MTKALFATCASVILLLTAGPAPGSFAPGFRKVSSHFYCLETPQREPPTRAR